MEHFDLYKGIKDPRYAATIQLITDEALQMTTPDRIRYIRSIRDAMNDRLAEHESKFSLKRWLGLG